MNTLEELENSKQKKRERYLVALVLVALFFSLGESLIPKPFPWMKLGIANIATLIALEKFDRKMALEVVVLRVVIQGLMLGTLLTPSFIISVTAGILSTLTMIALYKFRKHLSLLAISSMGAVVHNLTQLLVVYVLLFRNIEIYSRSILIFILIFISTGCLSGVITGYVGERMNLKRRKL